MSRSWLMQNGRFPFTPPPWFAEVKGRSIFSSESVEIVASAGPLGRITVATLEGPITELKRGDMALISNAPTLLEAAMTLINKHHEGRAAEPDFERLERAVCRAMDITYERHER